jgi:hypothetical protein
MISPYTVVANRVNHSFQFAGHRFHSSVPIQTLTTVDTACAIPKSFPFTQTMKKVNNTPY